MDKLQLYELALENMLANESSYHGLCHALLDTLSIDRYQIDYKNLDWDQRNILITEVKKGVWGEYNSLPEISKHSPTNHIGKGYWPIDHANRVEILKQAIAEVKADMAAKEDWDMNHYDGDSSQNE
jgi:hypothetical protein